MFNQSKTVIKIQKKSHKKSCAHEIIHLNNMHGECAKFNMRPNMFKPVYIYELKHVLDFHFHLFIKKPPHLLSRSACIHMHMSSNYYLSCMLPTGFISHGLDYYFQ